MRLYTRQQESALLSSLTLENKYALILSIEVLWQANVKADGRFHAVAVESTKLTASSFLPPTEEQIKLYQLGPLTERGHR